MVLGQILIGLAAVVIASAQTVNLDPTIFYNVKGVCDYFPCLGRTQTLDSHQGEGCRMLAFEEYVKQQRV
jgi:hypothetical protein